MDRASTHRRTKRITVKQIHNEPRRLRRRVEDLEDLRDLNAAIERNSGRPGVPWKQVRKQLGL